MSKVAFITGISGQDAAYLSLFLLKKGYKVIGGDRRNSSGSLWRLKELGIVDDVEIINFELSEFSNIYKTIEKISPDEIYNLAAQSFVASSFDTPLMTSDVTGIGVLRILESLRTLDKKIKFYQASSSEMFGKVQESPQNELTQFYPRSPYGVAKLYGHWITVNYRESHNIFACSGILFNHESPLRGKEFVTRKITMGLARIKSGLQNCLELGNIDSRRDWGFAKDYVEGMYLMLQHDKPDDYVLSNNKTHSVREFINVACKMLNIELTWEGTGIDEIGIDKKTDNVIIKINPKFYRPSEVDLLLGDSSKAKKILNWESKTSFNELVELMIKYDLDKLSSN